MYVKSTLTITSMERSVSTLFTLMDYPVHIETISMELSMLYFRGCRSQFL